MKKLIYYIACTLILMGCSKKIDKIIPSIETDEEWKEYVKDTTNLTIHFHNKTGNIFKIGGIKDQKLWFAKYDTNSKDCLFEFLDTEKFQPTRTFYNGYGEYETLTLKIDDSESFESAPYTYIYIMYQNEGIIDLYVLNSNNKCIYKSIASNETKKTYYNGLWFNDSFIISFNSSKPYCISKEGEKLFPIYQGNPNGLIPISMKEGIHLPTKINEFWTAGNTIYRINIETGDKLWEQGIDFNDIQSNAKTTSEYDTTNNDTWYYTLHITNYDGSKETRQISIDTSTGAITEQKS